MEDFDIRFASFLDGANKIYRDYVESNFPNLISSLHHLRAEEGRRYIKVIREGSVHCFVDKTNGDVLKAASYKAPAKHARGNIFNDDNGLGCMTPHGAKYLRG